MSSVFNDFPNPSLFSQLHFRLAYTLLPAIRNLIAGAINNDEINIVSIACGTALDASTFELIARSRGLTFNYFGCDINKKDLVYNYRVIRNKTPNINHKYAHCDIAKTPPKSAIAKADCILWRHPEFLSDHSETPKILIVKMCHILWNILKSKNEKSPVLITCYDPHEMMLVLELLQLFCENDLLYSLNVDSQVGRSSMKNPLVDSQDDGPLFNLNNHDQFQLLITSAKLKNSDFNIKNLVEKLSRALKNMLLIIPLDDKTDKIALLKALDKPGLDVYRLVVTYLNDQIRNASNPLLIRESISSFIIEHYVMKNLEVGITL